MDDKIEASPLNQPLFRAQFGEDKILADCFSGRADGYYAEIGAYDGIQNSNTCYFEAIGWTGILVEADPDIAERCRRARPGSQVVNCAVAGPDSPAAINFEVVEGNRERSSLSVPERLLRNVPGIKTKRTITVEARTIDSILENCRAPELDFITIDVEGYEWAALQGFDLDRWKPAIVILERNALPDARIVARMHRSGYCYLRTTGVNDWFQRASVAAARQPSYLLRVFLTCLLPTIFLYTTKQALHILGVAAFARSVAKRVRR